MVKIEEPKSSKSLAPQFNQEQLDANSDKKGKRRFTNASLPNGFHDKDRWWQGVIPTYLAWLGRQKDSWIVDEDVEAAALQTICDGIYGQAIPCVVQVNGPIPYIVRIFY
jgi:hypothetical protein